MDSVGFYYSVQFHFSCFAAGCDATAQSEKSQVSPYGRVPLPLLPSGWRQVDASVYCPKHRVTVQVEDV